jgi:hypothetical protein
MSTRETGLHHHSASAPGGPARWLRPLPQLHRVHVRGHPDACQERRAVLVAGDELDIPQLVVERRAPKEPEGDVHDDGREEGWGGGRREGQQISCIMIAKKHA